MAGQKGSKFSVGGMATKVQAAELCQKAGVNMVVALGDDPTIVYKIIEGEDVGTFLKVEGINMDKKQLEKIC